MTRDFSKDLTIMVAGSGNVTMQHLEETLAEWIFGAVEEREVNVILPVLSQMGGGIRNLIKLGTEWEFNFTVIQAKDAPMTRELSALPEESFFRVDDEHKALAHGFGLLTEFQKKDHETAFILAYNPKSTYEQGNSSLSDYEIIGDAKSYPELSTLNLCEGLIDSFEGYESAEEVIKREYLQKEFEDKQRETEAAKPKPERKAPVTRKRAAKKVEPQEPKPLLEEPEKPLEDVPVGTVVEVAGMEFTKKGPNPFREPLPGNPIHDVTREDVIAAGLNDPAVPLPDQEEPTDLDHINRIAFLNKQADIQNDIRDAQAQIEKRDQVAVAKSDLAELSQNIKELTAAFGNIMDTFTRILKES